MEAQALYRQILSLHPNHIQTLYKIGQLARQFGQNAAAIELFTRVVTLKPDWPDAHNDLGNTLLDARRIGAAIVEYEKALALRTDFAEAWNNLGNAQRLLSRLDEAIDAYRRALAVRPDLAEAHSNLGNVLKDTGALDEALTCYRRAAELKPDPRIAGSFLYAMHLHPDYGPRQIYQEHARWNQTYARPLAATIAPHDNVPDPQRRLRIGYVSPDFTANPVGRFLVPFLSNHDHARFEIFCYSDTRRPDVTTERLRACADTWRSMVGLSDEHLAATIREDRIDILIDLTLHAADNRLPVFARKPAPIQVSYLAYCSTTGLETMDYRFSDPFFDPHLSENPGSGNDPIYSERTIRLPRTYWCYGPPEQAGPVGPAPAASIGHVTFGCLNNFSKVNPAVLATWARLMRAVEGSELILHSGQGSHRRRVHEYFAGEKIDPRRVRFIARLPLAEYFDQYRQIDVGLDPFPFPGGTTTCDALWMGVPVVSLAGATAVSRGGLSILSNVGLPQLVARTPDEYVSIAAALAGDLSRLTELRSRLRQKMQASPLMDGPGFARDVDSAFRQMWRAWVSMVSC